MPQRAHTFQVNCCLKAHNAHRNYYRDKIDNTNIANFWSFE